MVRVGPDIFDQAHEQLTALAQAKGIEGRLLVIADEPMKPGDCKIEWADGRVNRDQTATLSAIDDVVGRYVAARAAQ